MSETVHVYSLAIFFNLIFSHEKKIKIKHAERKRQNEKPITVLVFVLSIDI